MYEHLRSELAVSLSKNFNVKDIELILGSLDGIMINYDVVGKSTALEVYDGSIPKEVDIYLHTMILEGKSKRTEKLYRMRLEGFFGAVKKPIYSITANDIRAYLLYIQQSRKIQDVTLEKIRQIIHVFFEWCVKEEYIMKNPSANIKKIKYEDKTRKALTRFQLEQLRRACKTSRERAIVEVLYSTGARVTELVNIKLSEIDRENYCVSVLGKGKRKYTVYFNETSRLAIEEYLKERTDKSDYLFVTEYTYKQISSATVESIFRTLSKRVGFYVCPHIMRHTFATMILQAGASIDVVQKALNHKSVATTQRYAETSQDDVVMAHKKYVV